MWKSESAFCSEKVFQQRLEQAGLTESQLLELLSVLATPGEAPAEPLWAVEATQALSDSSNEDFRLDSYRAGASPPTQFLELIRPFIARATRRLRAKMDSLIRPASKVPFEPGILETSLVNLLPNRLLPILLRTVVLELNVARVQGLLAGQTSEERFESFITRIQRPEVRLEFFQEYPVLGRQISTALEQWLSASHEFLQRWCRDWQAICAAFAPTADPGALTGIVSEAGDRHRAGRAVWIVQSHSGLKLVYKPRPMAVDRHFQEMLGWLNEQGLNSPFRRLKILDRGAYGWEEFVAPHGCSSREEVRRFYERSGGYLALLYALAATDFHHENVLAVGEHPILVDLEALFQSSVLEVDKRRADDFAGQSFLDSVLGSGLLPVPLWNSRDGDTFDVSGLGADEGQKLNRRAPGWEGTGTDQMHFARRQEVIMSGHHRPTLNQMPTSPLDYLEAMESGFRQVYRLLLRHREELLSPCGMIGRFARDEVRVVLRNTTSYTELLAEGSHPDVLRDALDRDRLFDRLWQDLEERPGLAPLIPAEIEDLWQGDVPLFTTRPESRDVWAGEQRHFKDVLDRAGLECARDRLRRFGPDNLERQIWFLRGSITTLALRPATVARARGVRTVESETAAGREQFLAAARAVGDRLEATAFLGAGEITWIGLTLMREKKWVLMPLGMDLYDGVPGIGLFLAYLGAVSGQERYTALARASLNTLRQRLRPEQRHKGPCELGGFTGWGGVLYTLCHLAVLWQEPALLKEAQEMVELLPERISRDKDFDIIAGAAGCIAGLLCLHSLRPSTRALEVAKLCGDHLLSQAREMPEGIGWQPTFAAHGPLTGFSHGAAGISWALLELAAHSGGERFRNAAVGGIAYERSLFCAAEGNWPDLRLPDTDPMREAPEAREFPVAWCHGAPGIALARLLCRQLMEDPRFDAEIESALHTTLAGGFGFNHCLCHGDLGNLELILAAAKAWPGSSWSRQGKRLAAGILNSISRDGWLCGNPLAVESPGLMTGLAGIGYGLLRCAEPAKVPSILSLAVPLPASQQAAQDS
jgi:type 2 lantibiotic biosynthesis protein LanM